MLTDDNVKCNFENRILSVSFSMHFHLGQLESDKICRGIFLYFPISGICPSEIPQANINTFSCDCKVFSRAVLILFHTS